MDSVCYRCVQPSCDGCACAVMQNWCDTPMMKQALKNGSDCDKFVERIYREMTDICWDEDEIGCKVLDQKFRGFPVGEFDEDDWLHWIDDHHSKGVGWVFENVQLYGRN